MPAGPRSNALALAVLGCLAERPMHPYEVAQTLRHRGVHESIKLNYGSLYSVVEALEKRGFVRAKETVKEGRRPDRTIYQITDLGHREFVDWLSELLSNPAKEYLQFEAALALIVGLPPDEALAQLKDRVELLTFKLAAGRATNEKLATHGLARIFILEAEYMLALWDAELEWIQGVVKDIENGSLDGLGQWKEWYSEPKANSEGGVDPMPREFPI